MEKKAFGPFINGLIFLVSINSQFSWFDKRRTRPTRGIWLRVGCNVALEMTPIGGCQFCPVQFLYSFTFKTTVSKAAVNLGVKKAKLCWSTSVSCPIILILFP